MTTVDFTCSLGDLLDKDGRTTFGTGLSHGPVPAGKATIGISVAGVEELAAPGFFLLQISFPTEWTTNPKLHWFRQRPHVFAFRITAASQEPTVFAPANFQGASTLLTDLSGFSVLYLDLTLLVPGKILGVFALRILRTGKELTVSTPFDHHHRPTFLTGDFRWDLFSLHISHFDLGLLEVAGERCVEALHDLNPIFFACLDFV